MYNSFFFFFEPAKSYKYNWVILLFDVELIENTFIQRPRLITLCKTFYSLYISTNRNALIREGRSLQKHLKYYVIRDLLVFFLNSFITFQNIYIKLKIK